jgi:hypothetical protein
MEMGFMMKIRGEYILEMSVISLLPKTPRVRTILPVLSTGTKSGFLLAGKKINCTRAGVAQSVQ